MYKIEKILKILPKKPALGKKHYLLSGLCNAPYLNKPVVQIGVFLVCLFWFFLYLNNSWLGIDKIHPNEIVRSEGLAVAYRHYEW